MLPLMPRGFHCVAIATALMFTVFLIRDHSATNSPPTAVDDFYTVHGFLFVPGNSVLTNDIGNSLHLASCSAASHGTAKCLLEFAAFSYEPNPSFVGQDSFTYQVCNSSGECDTGTVHLNVINNPPVAVADNFVVRGGGMLVVQGPNALRANDHDPD